MRKILFQMRPMPYKDVVTYPNECESNIKSSYFCQMEPEGPSRHSIGARALVLLPGRVGRAVLGISVRYLPLRKRACRSQRTAGSFLAQ